MPHNTIMYQDIKSALDKLSLLEEYEWEIFKQFIKKKFFKKGEWLIQGGMVERHLYFISKGLVRIYYIKEGKEINIDFRLEGQFVSSYTSFLTKSPTRQYIEALEETTCHAIYHHDLQTAYNMSKNGERLGRVSAEMLFIEKELQTVSLMLDSPDTRFNQLLKEKKEWLQRVPQKYLASYLHMAPETLSRVKKRSMIR